MTPIAKFYSSILVFVLCLVQASIAQIPDSIINTQSLDPSTSVGFPKDLNSSDSKQVSTISVDSSKIEIPEVMAQFPGGESKFRLYLMNRMRYPERCQEEGLSGRVRVQFVVEVDGRISDIKIIEHCKSCPEFEQEAIRVIRQSPRWVPGKKNDRFIRSYFVQPFIMALD